MVEAMRIRWVLVQPAGLLVCRGRERGARVMHVTVQMTVWLLEGGAELMFSLRCLLEVQEEMLGLHL